MDFTIIIPFFNGHEHIDRLVRSIAPALPKPPQILVVDDHSDTPLDAHLINKKYRNVRVLRPAQKGYFAGAVNAGIEAAGRDVLVLNQDVWFTDDRWLAGLASLDPRVAIAGDGVFDHPAWPMGYVQGTFMFLRRAAIAEVGLLNARDFPFWGGTAEWQLRAARAGWKAAPWREVPGFQHERPEGESFGSSARTLLAREANRRALHVRTPPLVSVVIPTYNHGRYLADAVHSLIGGDTTLLGPVKGQSFQAFEVIIVDDHSSDDTPEIGAALADPWKGIRYIRHTQNQGTPAANNTGIRAAYGKYITVMCADDCRETGSLERLYRAADAHPHRMVYDDVILMLNGGARKIWKLAEYSFEALLQKNFIHAGILFPKRAWQDVGGYPEAMRFGREDWAMNVALGIKGYCGVHVPVPGYIYRRHESNRTLTNTNPEWRGRFQSQMRSLYGNIYEGERPMGCCGSDENALLAGNQGMTLISYLGGNDGNEPFYGPVTGTRYVFSRKSNTRLVDNRDLRTSDRRGLLEMYENGHPLFTLAPKPTVQPVPVQEEPVQEETVQPEPEPEKAAAPARSRKKAKK